MVTKTLKQSADGANVSRARTVTSSQVAWQSSSTAAAGQFSLEVVLDHGADHHLLEVSAQDLKVILQLMKRSSTTLFDRDSLTLTFV